MRRGKPHPQPLVVEQYPENYNGARFLTLVRNSGHNHLTIIDNVVDRVIYAYNLDISEDMGLPTMQLVSLADEWYRHHRHVEPVSVTFSRHGVAELASRIMRHYHIDTTTRIVGPLPRYYVGRPIRTRKRVKRSPV